MNFTIFVYCFCFFIVFSINGTMCAMSSFQWTILAEMEKRLKETEIWFYKWTIIDWEYDKWWSFKGSMLFKKTIADGERLIFFWVGR